VRLTLEVSGPRQRVRLSELLERTAIYSALHATKIVGGKTSAMQMLARALAAG
jgi:hypothetical protein